MNVVDGVFVGVIVDVGVFDGKQICLHKATEVYWPFTTNVLQGQLYP